MTSLRASNWLNSLDAGAPDADGWLPICPLNDSVESEVRAELLARGFSTEDRNGQICVKHSPPPLPLPPKHYSKYRLLTGMLQADLLEAFLAWLDEDRISLALWDAATELSEEDGNFAAHLPEVLEAIGATPQQAADLLSSAEIVEELR